MGPKINGLSISDLVSSAVEKRLEEELSVYKASLDNALSKVKNLEEEMAHFREMSNNNFPISKSHSKNAICRHWLRNQCTWKQKCRFSHCQGSTSTSPSSSASSLSGSIAKDTEVVVKTSKVEKSVQVSFPMVSSSSLVSTSVVPKSSSALTRPSFVSGVLQPELVGAALTHDIAEVLSWYFYHHTEVNISSYLAFPKAEIFFFLFCQNIKLMAFNADIFRCMFRVENWSVTAEALSIILTWFYQGEIISRRAGVWVLVCEEIVNWSKTQPRLPFQGSIFHM